jgi:hypothetical protein
LVSHWFPCNGFAQPKLSRLSHPSQAISSGTNITNDNDLDQDEIRFSQAAALYVRIDRRHTKAFSWNALSLHPISLNSRAAIFGAPCRSATSPIPIANLRASMMARLKGLRSRMDRRQQILWSYAAIIRRGAILGGAVFLLLTDDPNFNFQLNIISYVVALLWSYYNGTFACGRLSVAWLEGLIVHMIGVVTGNLLILIFGSPLTAA